ncbi:elongation factor G [Methylocystis sp. MJC1]|jgi:elongation factor G|uniref:elongation factor G n=1 Tax=Methylocystis sp. MJC1 TaxID=2654282 RepID=UPI0013EB788E|nr:elongation factor G [Methylocystis sp. MJC1]KAF2991336.1 Elongation factor G [Methylocystis sp. MJC1]MBU6526125.1 elongation factor G [Methylocystis sp. MJC1]UZX12579.1 elongation factor G [Methylocystis sp. MJC1]
MGDTFSHEARARGSRLIALAGPFQSGKTTLLEAILASTKTIAKQGSVADGSSVGDASPEARAHKMSVEANFATIDYMGDRYNFIDLPGSIEFAHEARNILAAVDAAVVVCEADERKIAALQLTLRQLEELGVPHLLFLNKIDAATIDMREALTILQPASRAPLLLRQIPIWSNGVAVGFIDLALERAYVYREHAPSEVIEIPQGEAVLEKEARYSMLERLADYDDALMEELITDIEPPRDQVFDDLTKELRAGLVAPVFIGSAERGAGVTRLLKALRHEAPGVPETRARLGVAENGPPMARVLRTTHTSHGGKLSIARVLRGALADGQTVLSAQGEDRISGMSRFTGAALTKTSDVKEGDVVALGRLEHAQTGDTVVADGKADLAKLDTRARVPDPVHALALVVKDRKDEMRLTAAMAKLVEEDPSLVFVHDQEMSQIKLYGQGEMHLRVALERLQSRFGVTVDVSKPSVAYRETIRHKVTVRGRHKKQSGGHGQFGDVVLEVAPRERGEGFAFAERVHGGAVPRQYFSSVEAGCQDALIHGPLGFPVVDVEAVLTDGSYHTVDSSDMAFRTAARIGMSEALGKAEPILLEPVLAVDIFVPSEAMSRATGLVSARRGQIIGFGPREGWTGWDKLEALIPEAEMDNLIVELRSATAGAGYFQSRFDHLAEVVGRQARDIVAAHSSQPARMAVG